MRAATVKAKVNFIHTEGRYEENKPINGPISFLPVNQNMIIVPHYDALVLILCINGFDMHRVSVDPGSMTDLLQLPAFKQMKLSLGVVNSAKRILFGFNGAKCRAPCKSWAIHLASFVLNCRRLWALQRHNGCT